MKRFPVLKYLAILSFFFVQSCSMCSQQNVNMTSISDKTGGIQTSKTRESWSSLANIGYPIIADSIPSLILERL